MKCLLWSVLLAFVLSEVLAQSTRMEHGMTNTTDSLFASPDHSSSTNEPSAEPEPHAEGEPEPEPEAESEPEPEAGSGNHTGHYEHDGHDGHHGDHEPSAEPEAEPEPKASEGKQEPIPLSPASQQGSSKVPEPSKQDSGSSSMLALPTLLASMFIGILLTTN